MAQKDHAPVSRGIVASLCFGIYAESIWLGFAVYFALASIDAMLHTVKRSYLMMAQELERRDVNQ